VGPLTPRSGAHPPGSTPPGWPNAVRPSGSPGWERSAVAWLLDQCPPEYRGYPVVVRHPLVLCRLAAHHCDAGIDAVRRAISTARADLGDDLPAPAMTDLLEVLQAEQVRLLAVRRAVGLLDDALRGRRYVPRL
jgi:hypothetical protein